VFKFNLFFLFLFRKILIRFFIEEILLKISMLKRNLKISGDDNKSVKIFDWEKAVIKAGDNDIDLYFWEIAQFDLIQVV
jgi:hypothetical protein